jgi:2-hydroxy-6-oxonona-2,4-dienedioate hydrolase
MNEQKYRQAEQRLWNSVGLEPREHRVEVRGAAIRVQEVGDGDPVLFIHGGPNAGATWAGLLRHFGGYRALVVDRPGTGLSEPVPLSVETMPDFAATFVGDVLTPLGLGRAHVVASSLGGYLALRSASAHPDRIIRMVQMACPAFVPGMAMPPFMRLMTLGWVRRLLNSLPPSEKVGRSMLRQIGHGSSLDTGAIPQDFFDWYLALQQHTDTMRNDGALIGEGGSFSGWKPDLLLAEAFFSTIVTPTLFLWGEDDAFGGRGVAEGVVGSMPDADLRMFSGAGHLPWLDHPKEIAAATAGFLSGRLVQ